MSCGCGNVPCRHIVITNNSNCGDEKVTVTQPLMGVVQVTAVGPRGASGSSGSSGISGSSGSSGSSGISGSSGSSGSSGTSGNNGSSGSSGTSGSSGANGVAGFGWARYDDGQYTTGSSFLVNEGQVVVLPNNGAFSEETYMNSTVDFYNPTTKKIQMENVGDVYSVVVTFRAKAPNANQTHIDLSLSSTGITPYDRVSKSLGFIKGNNEWENYYEIFNFYADADFVTNGNQWKIAAIGGDVSVANAIYFIQRTFNAGV